MLQYAFPTFDLLIIFSIIVFSFVFLAVVLYMMSKLGATATVSSDLKRRESKRTKSKKSCPYLKKLDDGYTCSAQGIRLWESDVKLLCLSPDAWKMCFAYRLAEVGGAEKTIEPTLLDEILFEVTSKGELNLLEVSKEKNVIPVAIRSAIDKYNREKGVIAIVTKDKIISANQFTEILSRKVKEKGDVSLNEISNELNCDLDYLTNVLTIMIKHNQL
ncbi:MAG: hypothetical protein ACP6IU_10715 [Candidatus Asgardarchaeia archaeon]